MNELKIFEKEEFGRVRTVTINGEPWFVGKDVAGILGYQNPQKALRDHIEQEDMTVNEMFTVNGTKGILINEAGLYALILSSKLPEAKNFKHWVTSEVLPSIRKTGGYIAGQENMSDDELMAKALMVAQRTIAERNKLIDAQRQMIGELTPKAQYVDRILDNKGLVTISQIAKDYGMSGNKLNRILSDLKVQYKQSGQWLLYSAHQSKGWTHSKTIDIVRSDGRPDIVMETKWTQKGRLALYALLKSKGILPMIERS